MGLYLRWFGMKTQHYIISSPNDTAQDKTLLDDFRVVLLCFLKLRGRARTAVAGSPGQTRAVTRMAPWQHPPFAFLPNPLPLAFMYNKPSLLGQWGEQLSCFGRGDQNCGGNPCRKRPTGLIVFRSSIGPSCPRELPEHLGVMQAGSAPR